MSATTALLALAATWVGVGLLLIWVMGGHGHDPFAWWLLGTLLGPLVLPLAISAERRRGDQAWLIRAGRPGRGPVDVLADLDASVEHDRAQARARAELERQARLVQLRLSTRQHAPDDGRRVPALVLATGRPAEVLPRLAAEGGYDLLVVGRRSTGPSKVLLGSTATAAEGDVAAAPGRHRAPAAVPAQLRRRRPGHDAQACQRPSGGQPPGAAGAGRRHGRAADPLPDDYGPARPHPGGHDRRAGGAAGAATAPTEAQNAITLFI